MKRIIAMLMVVVLVLVGLVNSPPAYSTAEKRSVEIYAASNSDYQTQVANLFDKGFEQVDVIFTDSADYPSFTKEPADNNEIKQIGPVKTYYVKNVRKAADYVGKSRIASADGPPGVKISIEETKSVSSTVSGTYSASYSGISAAVGWNVTVSTSVAIKGEYDVPYKVGKKKVKRGYLDAYPKYKTKKYDVYYGIKGTSNETKKGTGTARKAIGVSYTKYNKYK